MRVHDEDRRTGAVDPDAARTPTRRRGRRLRRVLVTLLACIVCGALVVVGTGVYAQHRLLQKIDRLPDVFTGLPNRPAPASGAAARAMNVLLMGSDRRSDSPTTGRDATARAWVPGEQRSDTMMLLHFSSDRRHATVVSIPRDSWVDVPGHGRNKINAAFSYGGPRLAVQTVENLTGVRIDHVAMIDWDGFQRLTDALGGVRIDVPQTVYDSARKKTWTAGVHEMDGAEALLYVRQRHGLPGGDFDRVKRQQNLIRALAGKLISGGTLTNPVKLYHALSAVSESTSVDSGWTDSAIRSFALSLRHLRDGGLEFTTAPVRGTGREGAQDVVYLDDAAGRTLWHSIRTDHAGQWFERHPGSDLGSTVR